MVKAVFKMRIKKGDTVIVRSGKYRGRSGKVIKVHPTINKVTIEGINVVKRHRKPTQLNPRGGVSEITRPIGVSKIGLLDSSTKKASRIGYRFNTKGEKIRILKLSGKEVN